MQHAAVNVTRVQDGFEFRRDSRRRVDEREDVWHVLAEERERHFRVERVDGGGEGLSAPDGGDERFAYASAVSSCVEARQGMRTVEELLVQLRQLPMGARRQLDEPFESD